MKKYWKRVLASFLMLVMCIPVIAAANSGRVVKASEKSNNTVITKVVKSKGSSAPKYIFLFIGDGMSYPQIQAAAYYLGATESNGGVKADNLSFMNFPIAGTAQTFDSTSFCPDSASTATSISTGNKTYSGTINMDTSKTTEYETIAEKLKKQLGFKIGIISSVNLNHATPAAFYAHQASRNNYYEIGLEMIESDFDYFAGGALISPTGNKKDQKDLYQLAKAAGYNVVRTQKEAESLKVKDGKSIVIAEKLADSDSMSYDIDAVADEWKLADYVQKGIDVLDNKSGFFMMVEGGKIDWSGHANDAASTIHDTVALSNAVNKALEFYNKHPEETLILVTGDHETGGLTIGFAGTEYNTYLKNLQYQKLSYAKFDTQFVSQYKKNNTEFSQVLADIQTKFGLTPEYLASSAVNPEMVLTYEEYDELYDAYAKTLSGDKQFTDEEYVKYGTYEPLTVTITHILNNKSGIAYTSYSHTGIPVPVFALGNGAELFEGYYDNTDIYDNMAELVSVK